MHIRQFKQNLHPCFLLNNHEKFGQLEDMVLILVDLDYIVSVFTNELAYISESFLCKINVDTIRNVLFKTMK